MLSCSLNLLLMENFESANKETAGNNKSGCSPFDSSGSVPLLIVSEVNLGKGFITCCNCGA